MGWPTPRPDPLRLRPILDHTTPLANRWHISGALTISALCICSSGLFPKSDYRKDVDGWCSMAFWTDGHWGLQLVAIPLFPKRKLRMLLHLPPRLKNVHRSGYPRSHRKMERQRRNQPIQILKDTTRVWVWQRIFWNADHVERDIDARCGQYDNAGDSYHFDLQWQGSHSLERLPVHRPLG